MSGQSSNDDILLFIMRHGEAESLRLDDKSRNLTEEGRLQSQQASHWIINQYLEGGSVDLALVSPYRRARQTFDALSLDLSAKKMELCNDITPEGNADLVHSYLDARLNAGRIDGNRPVVNSLLVVSHMPLVSYLVDSLCCSHTTSLFATASVAVIRYSLTKQCGTLLVHYQGD